MKLYCLSSSKSVRTTLIAEANITIQEGKDVSLCIDSECHDNDEASNSSNTNIVSKHLSVKDGLLSVLQSPDQKGSNSETKVSSYLLEPTF